MQLEVLAWLFYREARAGALKDKVFVSGVESTSVWGSKVEVKQGVKYN